MKKRDWRETLYRAARTFAQVAIPSAATLLVAAIQGGEQITWTVIQGVLVTACATGLAALMNLPKPNKTEADEYEEALQRMIEAEEDRKGE